MKIVTICSSVVFAMTAFAGHANDKQPVGKAPVLMTDAQMQEVIGGSHVGPGFGICTAVGKAHAPGAIKNFGPNATMNLPGNGNLNGNGRAPGFGQQTAGKATSVCGIIGEI